MSIVAGRHSVGSAVKSVRSAIWLSMLVSSIEIIQDGWKEDRNRSIQSIRTGNKSERLHGWPTKFGNDRTSESHLQALLKMTNGRSKPKPMELHLSSVRQYSRLWKPMAILQVKPNRVSSKETNLIWVTYHLQDERADGSADASRSYVNQLRWLIQSNGSILRPESKRESLENTNQRTGGSNGDWRSQWQEPSHRLRRRMLPLEFTMDLRRRSPRRLRNSLNWESSTTCNTSDLRIVLPNRSSVRFRKN